MKFFKKHIAIFLVLILVSFGSGVLVTKLFELKPISYQIKAADPVNTLQRLSKISPLSIFSKQLLAQAQGPQQPAIPSGFCLSIPVLLYHHIQPQSEAVAKGQTSLNVDNGIFDQQMAYLASKGYTTISADTLVGAILSHTRLPGRNVVVTMDDGYLDNYTYAYPVLQKYHIIANLMIPTGLLGNSSGTNTYLSWDNLNTMQGSGLIYIYNHTWSHYSLAAGPVDKDTFEIDTAQQQLHDHLGKVSPIFTYPYGSGATTSWVIKLLKDHGYVAAFSTLPGRYQCDSNIMALPRIHVGNAPLSSYGL